MGALLKLINIFINAPHLTNANSKSDVRDIAAHPGTLCTNEESTLPEAKSEEQYVT